MGIRNPQTNKTRKSKKLWDYESPSNGKLIIPKPQLRQRGVNRLKKSQVNYSLYLVTDRKLLGDRDLCKTIEDAIKGGVTLVQLREKNTTTNGFINIATNVKKITNKYNIPLIINDRIDVALAIDADGVHVGPDDMSINMARKLLGQDKIIGASTNCVKEALEAESQGADYLGVGAMFPTKTKNNTEDVSIDELRNIKKLVNIPIVAIGGVNEKNASSVIAAGIDGIAVVSAILGKEDVFQASKGLRNLV